MRQRSEREEVVEVKPICGTFSLDGSMANDEHCEPTDDTKGREGIERLNALLATLPPFEIYEGK